MKNENNSNLSTEIENNPAASVAAQWGRPDLEKTQPETNRLRLRTEDIKAEVTLKSGRVESTLILREAASEDEESQDIIQAKRQNFKSIFVAGVRR